MDAVALREGDTPLHLAVLGRHVCVAEVLLSAGARTDVCNRDDCTGTGLGSAAGTGLVRELTSATDTTAQAQI